MSPLLAQSGHSDRAEPCPLLGVKRTFRASSLWTAAAELAGGLAAGVPFTSAGLGNPARAVALFAWTATAPSPSPSMSPFKSSALGAELFL